MTDSPQPPLLSGRERDLLISRLITKALTALAAVAIVSVIQALRLGVDWRYALLIVGSILSGVLLIAYPIRIIRDHGKTERDWTHSLIIFGGFVPYLFGCYLVFYEGFWRLRLLSNGFSFFVLAVASLFLLAGYLVVSGIYKATEFGRAVADGRIRVY